MKSYMFRIALKQSTKRLGKINAVCRTSPLHLLLTITFVLFLRGFDKPKFVFPNKLPIPHHPTQETSVPSVKSFPEAK